MTTGTEGRRGKAVVIVCGRPGVRRPTYEFVGVDADGQIVWLVKP